MTPIPDFIPLTPLPKGPEGYRELKLTDRVLRHFAVTCAERCQPKTPTPERERLLVGCRDFADGRIDRQELDRLRSAYSAAYSAADLAAYLAACSVADWAADRAAERQSQSRLLTLHLPSEWSPDWRTEATANLAEQIAAGDLSLAGPLNDILLDLGCDNEIWLRILRECPEIIRPGMWFLDRLRGVTANKSDDLAKIVRDSGMSVRHIRPNRVVMG